jgi:TIR domain
MIFRMPEDRTTVSDVAFFKVSVPQSAGLVRHLGQTPEVKFAAVVYSEVDVITVLDGTREQVDRAYESIRGAPPIVDGERYAADEVVRGLSFGSRQQMASNACLAFVQCELRVEMPYAISVLAAQQGVVRLFPRVETGEVILELVAEGKGALDELVMSAIQHEAGVVAKTSTHIAINHMRWHRDGPTGKPLLFIGLADRDLPFVLELSEQIERDCGFECWTFQDIPIGVPWPPAVDEAMDAAQCWLFVISKAALASDEFNREWGRAAAISAPGEVCGLVLSDCKVEKLPVRFRQQELLLSADRFLAYPRLLDWLLERQV